MNIKPKIETLPAKKFIGKYLKMSLVNNRTAELWGSFMPVKKEIKNNLGFDLFSMQQYDKFYFNRFNPAQEFTKWAVVEVTNFDVIPNNMGTITANGGLYAVFIYKGEANKAFTFFQYIFETWLPESKYVLDNRIHFEVLGEKYKNNDPTSEEEIWIPIKLK